MNEPSKMINIWQKVVCSHMLAIRPITGGFNAKPPRPITGVYIHFFQLVSGRTVLKM